MLKVAMNGACGRMGSRIISLLQEDSETQLSVAIERPGHESLGMDVGDVLKVGKMNVELCDCLCSAADVVVDFSAPESTAAVLKECIGRNIPILICTTGHSDEQIAAIGKASENIPVLIAPNTSVGVNVFFRLAVEAAKALGESFDIEIVEAHHRFKKDAPSGTANHVAQLLAEATGRNLAEDGVYGRHGHTGERTSKEIGIHAIRAGDIVGDHTVLFSSLGERIELTHRAHTRDTFARGAIRAAKFLAQQKPGRYGMEDVLF